MLFINTEVRSSYKLKIAVSKDKEEEKRMGDYYLKAF